MSDRRIIMKICFLAPSNNYHTRKWCEWFLSHGYEIVVISLTDGSIDGVKVYNLLDEFDPNSSDFKKLKYFSAINKIKKIIRTEQPDTISVHYASSYGLLAALAGSKDLKLSVWGSDIFEFPKRSPIHKALLKYALSRASIVLSTSEYMAKETKKYTKKDVVVTPFGVDMDLFDPNKRTRMKDDDTFVIGTVKSLKPVYGIDHLIRAVGVIKREHPNLKLELRIAGDGPSEKEYMELAQAVGLGKTIKWLGFISQDQAAKEWADMDLGVIYSNEESFGVSAIEAQACGTPLVISDAPGLIETTRPSKSSIVVERGQEEKLAEVIAGLISNKKKLNDMGKNGREYVKDRYEINKCFFYIEKIICSKQSNGSQ